MFIEQVGDLLLFGCTVAHSGTPETVQGSECVRVCEYLLAHVWGRGPSDPVQGAGPGETRSWDEGLALFEHLIKTEVLTFPPGAGRLHLALSLCSLEEVN